MSDTRRYFLAGYLTGRPEFQKTHPQNLLGLADDILTALTELEADVGSPDHPSSVCQKKMYEKTAPCPEAVTGTHYCNETNYHDSPHHCGCEFQWIEGEVNSGDKFQGGDVVDNARSNPGYLHPDARGN